MRERYIVKSSDASGKRHCDEYVFDALEEAKGQAASLVHSGFRCAYVCDRALMGHNSWIIHTVNHTLPIPVSPTTEKSDE